MTQDDLKYNTGVGGGSSSSSTTRRYRVKFKPKDQRPNKAIENVQVITTKRAT